MDQGNRVGWLVGEKHSFECWENPGEDEVCPQLAQSVCSDHDHLFLRDLSHNLFQTLDIELLVNLSALVEL